jgi:predicted porin
MTSTLNSRAGTCALLAVLGLFASGMASANAADLGGNCCADLEERIAELEATTARKGNRKVSLEISGQVNEAIMFWDDGFESNANIVTNDNSRSRFRFKGEAKILDGFKAGYLIEIGVRDHNSKRFTQDNDEGNDNPADVGLDVRHSYWYLDSRDVGRISLGQTGGAAEGVTEINQSQTASIAKYSDQEDTALGLSLRQTNGLFSNGTTNATGAVSWRRLIGDNGDQPGEGRRSNIIKYDTPTWQGFIGTVNWGEDDFWEVGARYAGELSGFKLAAGIAYGENTEFKQATSAVGFECLAQNAAGIPVGSGTDAKCHQIGGSVSVMHVESGIYVNFGAGQKTDELINKVAGFATADDTSTFWAAEAGIEKKWNALGKTTLFGQYYINEGGANARRTFGAGNRILSTELESYGGGVVQGVDAAAMQLYLFYRHSQAEITGSAFSPNLEDLDVVTAGAIIKF